MKPRSRVSSIAGGKASSRLDKTKPRGELARPEARLMEALPFAGATIEQIKMLALVVAGPRFRRHLEPRFDHICDVDENGRRPLLAVFVDEQEEIADVAGLHRLANGRSGRLVSNLIAPDGLEANRLQDVDRLDDPADGRLPMNRFEDAARS